MKLDAIDWAGVLRAAEAGGSVDLSPLAALDLKSLSALFSDNFAEAIGRVLQARTADPFNPVHAVRLALLLMRFGDWETAAELAQSWAQKEPDLAIAGYLWGLATLRGEEPKRASNIAQDVLTAH